jgi:hypothetical protein
VKTLAELNQKIRELTLRLIRVDQDAQLASQAATRIEQMPVVDAEARSLAVEGKVATQQERAAVKEQLDLARE